MWWHNRSLAIASVDLAIVAAVWCLAAAVVNPVADFPLSDDWSYSVAVKRLLEEGTFMPTGWTSMPLITNVGWGALFCLPAGFSFTALRLSTLVSAMLGLGGIYALAMHLHIRRSLAMIATLSVAFNPIYYEVSHTFLTDVPCLTLVVFAALFFVRDLRRSATSDLLLGTVFATLATLSRQLAVAVSLAYSVTAITKTGWARRDLARAAVPSIVCVAALLSFRQWLLMTGRLPLLYDQQTHDILHVLLTPGAVVVFVVTNVYRALPYLGLFLLPTLIVGRSIFDTQRPRAAVAVFALSTLLLAGGGYAVLGERYRLPMLGTTVWKTGLGPLTLKDTFVLKLNHFPEVPGEFWVSLTAVALVAAALLTAAIASLVSDLRRARQGAVRPAKTEVLFLVTCALFYLLPVLTADLIDRYLIPPAVFLGLALLSARREPAHVGSLRGIGAAIVIAIFAVFAVGGTRDYMTWNRARWQALHDLTDSGTARPDDIDGGFEFNGFHMYDPAYQLDSKKSWWWVRNDTYQVGFQPIDGYAVIKRYRYSHWLPPFTGNIVVLKAADSPAAVSSRVSSK